MEKPAQHIMIVAGEASGDIHAAHLAAAIKKLSPKTTFSGYGGRHMREAGVEILYDLPRLALVGFWEVLNQYVEIRRVFNEFLAHADRLRPTCVILVDYPGFNLRLAKKLKAQGIKVVYYISPQLWAWKENRVESVRKYVDEMLVLFPFEVDFYRRHGIEVTHVGHPLIENIEVTTSRRALLEKHGLVYERLTIGLLPGSREKEITRILPIMLETARLLMGEYPHIQFLVPLAGTLDEELIRQYLPESSANIKVTKDCYYDTVNACEACIVTSGTATLEVALMEKPMIVVYKTSLLTYLLARMFVKIKNIGLVNVVAGKRVVPECVQHEARPKRIASLLKEMLGNEIALADIKLDLKRVKESLGGPGASQRAAKAVLKTIGG